HIRSRARAWRGPAGALAGPLPRHRRVAPGLDVLESHLAEAPANQGRPFRNRCSASRPSSEAMFDKGPVERATDDTDSEDLYLNLGSVPGVAGPPSHRAIPDGAVRRTRSGAANVSAEPS